MKFDEAINYIAETTIPVANEMARPKNLAFQKWKEENPGVPTYKFFKQQRELKKAGDVPAVAAPAAPVAEPTAADAPQAASDSPSVLRTKEAVAAFLKHNPGASEQEVIDTISSQSTDETPLDLDPATIKAAMADAQGSGTEDISEPSADELKKSELAAKYERMRQALYKARGLKAKPRGRSSREVEPAEDEDEGGFGRGINMRDEPIDPNEL